MDFSQLKGLGQKLSFIRHYSSLVIPAAVAVVAGLLFVPTKLISKHLREQVENESVSVGRTIDSASTSAPPREQWTIEQQYQQAYENDANQVAVLAKQTTLRELLSYKLFPEPKDKSVLIFKEFGQQYRNKIDELVRRENGHDCPSQAEFERSTQSTSAKEGVDRYRSRSRDIDATIRDALCREKAESATVYVNPWDISGYGFWEGYEHTISIDEATENCWYWQLAYWIAEDVFKTVEKLNAGSQNVYSSSVKRLLGVRFVASRGQRVDESGLDYPKYVLSKKDGLTEAHTGRLCDESMDVVHFGVSVVINSKAVLRFMQELCSAKEHIFKGYDGQGPEQVFKHNQITILETEITPIDRADNTHNLYRYGEDAIVRMELVCEYTFNKSAYEALKPKLVKDAGKKDEEEEE